MTNQMNEIIDYLWFKNLFQGIEAIITSISMLVGAWWVYRKYISQQEKYPNINFVTTLNVIGMQGNKLIVELNAIIENKGKAQHEMKDLFFELNGLLKQSLVSNSEKWNGQVDFPEVIKSGSFRNPNPVEHYNSALQQKVKEDYQIKYFFVDPGTIAKYTYIISIEDRYSFLMLHSTFKYKNRNSAGHTAEKTIRIKNEV